MNVEDLKPAKLKAERNIENYIIDTLKNLSEATNLKCKDVKFHMGKFHNACGETWVGIAKVEIEFDI